MTRLFALLLVAALIGIAFAMQGSRLGREWVITRLSAHDGGYSIEKCESDLLTNFNAARRDAGLPAVAIDEDLQKWLRTDGSKFDVEDTQGMLKGLQETDLCYAEYYVTSASAISKQTLAHQFDPTAQQSNPRHLSIGAVVREVENSYGYEVLLVLGRKLKPFKPERLTNADASEFAVTCPHCKAKYGLHAQASGSGLFLRCPKCKLNGGVLATDALGTYRWANEFLVGYQPPARYPEDITRDHEMFIIWNTVNADCAYRKDHSEPGESRDAWQTPLETMVRGQGDCEDTSLLLADWLIARGFDARVAIGKLNGGGHAWCVVRLDGIEYLLESTNASPNMDNMPFADKLGTDYEPETLFDRDHIYVPADGRKRLGRRYFSDDWLAITPRARSSETTTSLAARASTSGTGPRTVSVRRPNTDELKSQARQFPDISKLADLAHGIEAWQFIKPFAAARNE